ncbi:hypothetical protein METBIDRAFT_43401 [Metschnikowia bicuspidata var. bicuspidata NRRL YB-4993]|uniref:Uncharacterized protein n=1 Tax=Metschnikowia bicuspidata var. bicuspidata NRRL YB-4993 TaxID=869754 RepID=A0A1A0H8K5_9ASCO|nr:hypothetical protein METBIDRAFT_43401 [Metschnikowia bicuspidata var. bicuspidata NRRL YB-4993]OBA20351.1 hypothetical protein METBIDRAFT_43401 [Metschnikowia bicuspidata var. bicuspidata NRRL YB-4993]
MSQTAPVACAESSGTPAATDALRSEKPRRVKVYLLQGDDWLDNGTGYCTGEVDGASSKPCFVVRSELDSQHVLMQSFLEGSIQYQRQQETLIVWTDLRGKDLALSFQENDGCRDLCDFIVRAQQGRWAPQVSLYYVLLAPAGSPDEGPREITELITGPVAYPPREPDRAALAAVLDLLTQAAGALFSRLQMLAFLADSHYFDALFRLFRQREAARDLDAVLCLNDIVKAALHYNEPRVVAELVSSETRAMDFAGVLEYDRTVPGLRACHRQHLQDRSRLKTVVHVPLPPHGPDDPMDPFRRDFVLQYLRGVALAHVLDEPALAVLEDLILSNHLDILAFLQDAPANGNFLARLFALYDAPGRPQQQARDGVRLVHQYVLVAKAFPACQLAGFFAELVRRGVLKMVKHALCDPARALRAMGIEILTAVIDQDVALVGVPLAPDDADDSADDACPGPARPGHTPESSDSIRCNLMTDMSLTLALGSLLLNDPDPALKTQTYEAIKSLLCSTVFDVDFPAKTDGDAHVKSYFEAFYEQVAPTLFAAFIDLAGPSESARQDAERRVRADPALFQRLCDLISFCCHEHESAICRPFFTRSGALDGIVRTLALDVHVTMKLAVLRCFKSLILLNDHAFCCYMIHNDLFAPFFAFFDTVVDQDSLVNSLCLDLLGIIIKRSSHDSFGCLAVHMSLRYRLFLESRISYVSTGRDLLASARRFKDRAKDSTVTSVDLDQGHCHSIHPSSPIAREVNGCNTTTEGRQANCSLLDAHEG